MPHQKKKRQSVARHQKNKLIDVRLKMPQFGAFFYLSGALEYHNFFVASWYFLFQDFARF